MVAFVFVDFAEGCTGAVRQVSHWVMRARSFASGSFPRHTGSTLGTPHKAAHMPKNPVSLRIPHPCRPVCGSCGNKQQVTSCDKLTTESDTCVLSLTLSNMPALIAKYRGSVFQREPEKKKKIILSPWEQGAIHGGRITGAADEWWNLDKV